MNDWSLVRYDIPLVLFCCLHDDDGLEFFLLLFLFFDYPPGCHQHAISHHFFHNVFSAFCLGWVMIPVYIKSRTKKFVSFFSTTLLGF